MDINCIKFNPTQNLIASASDDGFVSVWRINLTNDEEMIGT